MDRIQLFISIVVCLCTVTGTVIALAKLVGEPLSECRDVMIKLTEAVKNQTEQLQKVESNNHEAHVRMHKRIDDVQEDVKEIDSRLSRVEGKQGV